MRMWHKAHGGRSYLFFLEIEKFEIPNKDNKVAPLFWQGSNLIITVSPLHIPCAILIAKDYMCVPLEFMGRCSIVFHIYHTASQNKVNFVTPGRVEKCVLRFFTSVIPYTRETLCSHMPPSEMIFGTDEMRSQEGLISSRHLYQLNHIKWRYNFYSNTLCYDA